MKHPKLPWWGWALLAVYAWGVARSMTGGLVNALLWPLNRLKPKDTRPIEVLDDPTSTDPSEQRAQNIYDKYKGYLATTPNPSPLTFDAWMLIQTGEADTAAGATTMTS